MNRREFLAAVPGVTVEAAVAFPTVAAASPASELPPVVWPVAAEIQAMAREAADALVASRDIFRHFPVSHRAESMLTWETMDGPAAGRVLDRSGGQAERGRGGQPARVLSDGTPAPVDDAKARMPLLVTYSVPPGHYGEYAEVYNEELAPRIVGSLTMPATPPAELIRQKVGMLVARRVDRMEHSCWSLAVKGTFRPPGMAHPIFAGINFASLSHGWDKSRTDPVDTLKALSTFEKGRSVLFNEKAVAYANRTTCNVFAGRVGLDPEAPEAELQAGLDRVTAAAKAPRLVIMDHRYAVSLGGVWKFRPHLPNGIVAAFGYRPGPQRGVGQPAGEYRILRNANNPDLSAGPYTRLITNENAGGVREVHDGHNGGPLLYWPADAVSYSVLDRPYPSDRDE